MKITPLLHGLAGFYVHLGELAKGYEKDQVKLADALGHVDRWIAEVNRLQAALKS